MRRALSIAIAASLGLASAAPTPAPTIEVSPAFWRGQLVPGFLVTCRNASDSTRTVVEHVRDGPAFRLDGRPYGQQEPQEGIAMGAENVVPAGGRYTYLILLGDTRRTYPLGLLPEDYASRSYVVPLRPGRHSISFRCWTDWSDEVRFAWGSSRRLRGR